MSEVNIREARRRLSSLVDAAQRGESTVIVRYGRAVAKIEPLEPQTAERLPGLEEFRSQIEAGGKPLSRVVVDERRKARY